MYSSSEERQLVEQCVSQVGGKVALQRLPCVSTIFIAGSPTKWVGEVDSDETFWPRSNMSSNHLFILLEPAWGTNLNNFSGVVRPSALQPRLYR